MTVCVRSFQPEDESGVREICCDTAWYGTPIDPVFSDREFLAEALIRPYVRFEPESMFVAEDAGRVVGYLTGCVDTRRLARAFTIRIFPALVWKFLVRGHWLRWKTLRCFFSLGLAEFRHAGERRRIVAEFPAHCHLNVSATFQHAGIGSALFTAFQSRPDSRRVRGVHIATATGPGESFFQKAGFSRLSHYPIPPLPWPAPKGVLVMGKKLAAS